MFFRVFIAFLLCFTITAATAQKNDSLFVTVNEGAWLVSHRVAPGENVVTIAHAFHVPVSTLADINGIPATPTPVKKNTLNIPIGDYNLLKSHPAQSVSARVLLYRCKKGDNVFRLSNRLGISQDQLNQWNNLQSTNFYEGQVLYIGWVLYDNGQLQDVAPAVADTLSPEQHIYLSQTANETNVTEEKGTAVFYEAIGRAKGPFYAFHNGTPRGTIIKVFNPGNGKTIYVKVMGALPDTKQYYNATIGISGTARAALGVTEDKAWCELKFASN